MSADNYTNILQPPVGTSYDELETITVFENKELFYRDSDNSTVKTETLTWHVDLYKYVTGAKPTDPNFRQNGGTIYIVMVHRGVANNSRASKAAQYAHRVTVPSTITPVRHYPATDTGTQDGNNWDYGISFKQRMPMFKNGGNSSFDFDAEYQETFTRIKAKQDGAVTSTGVQYSVDFPMPPGVGFSWPIVGLTLFKTQDPSIFPLKFDFEVYVYEYKFRTPGYERYCGTATTSTTVDFKFTA